jgi:hypothetical protein
VPQRIPVTPAHLAVGLLLAIAILAGSAMGANPSGAAALPAWLSRFSDPPATYRPQMLWVMNGRMNRERTTEMAEQFAARGIGGGFIHQRPGLVTEYLSPQFFEQWQWALRECRRLGLECHVYDENTFPSGFAGGEVVARNPDLAARYLTPVRITDPDRRPDEPVVACAARPEGDGRPRFVPKEAVASATKDRPVWALVVRTVAPKAQHGGRPYPDLLRPETTEIFLRVTHDRYAQHFGGHFGEAIRYVYTDEPNLLGRQGLPWSDYLLEEFRRDHGYDLHDRLEALCFGGPDAPAVRFDYFRTVSRLWIENLIRPISAWCEDHNLAFTGHLWEHEWPVPEKQPVVMHTYRWMQTPGTDLLGFHFHPTAFEDQLQTYLNQKELSSIGNQLGRRRLFCESSGAGGYGMALRDFKPLEDVALACGITLMAPHLAYQTLAGARKYDWPQTISDHAPWWDAYRLQADHVGRVAYTLDQGAERNRILVLHPCTTGWVRYQHKNFLLGEERKDGPLKALRRAQHALLRALHRGQVDFDLGDELTLAELGKVEDGRLRVDRAAYEAVVVPPVMDNWTADTLRLMAAWLDAGGTLYACGEPPTLVDGRPSDGPAALARRHPKRWKRFPSLEAMVAAVREGHPPRLSRPDGSPLPENLLWHRRERPDGSAVWFLCHPWNEPLNVEVRLKGRSAVAFDTVRGTARHLATRPAPDRRDGQLLTLDLPALGHALLVTRPQAGPDVSPVPEPTWRGIDLEAGGNRRLAPNVLVCLFCNLEAPGVRAEGVNTTRADEMNWKAHGCDGNIWSHSSQFRRTLIETTFTPDSGFSVTYTFTIAPEAVEAVRDSLEIAVERPWLYDITLNERVLAFPTEEQDEAPARWFDPNIRKRPVGEAVQAGRNLLRLSARPMRPLCEIMPVYVLGGFALAPAEKGFVIERPRPVAVGPWKDQGLPFYPQRVAYRYTFTLNEPAAGVAVTLPEWSGSAAWVRLDGEEAGVIAWPPDRLEVKQALAPGNHTLEVVVAGNLKNMLGPHFSEGLPGIWSWRWPGKERQPPEKYLFAPTGLVRPPFLQVHP